MRPTHSTHKTIHGKNLITSGKMTIQVEEEMAYQEA
jgi:hypothetical protein